MLARAAALARVRPTALVAGARRAMGAAAAHHDDHHHHHEEAPLSKEAQEYENTPQHLWGEAPLPAGEKRHVEEWEGIHWFFLAGTVALCWMLAKHKPNTNVHDWAWDEAMERMRRREAGLPVEFGVNYSAIRYMKERGALSEEEAEALEAGAIPEAYIPALPTRPLA